MSSQVPTPTTSQYIRDYEDAANNAMVEHMAQMMRMTPKEAMAFMAMNQSILEPFLRGVSPPLVLLPLLLPSHFPFPLVTTISVPCPCTMSS